MEAGNTKKPRITTLDDLFGIPPSPIPNAAEVQIQEIELSKLHEFKGHPFKVLEDQALFDMAKSIQEIGQLLCGGGACQGILYNRSPGKNGDGI